MPILFSLALWADIGCDEPAYKLAQFLERILWFNNENFCLGIPLTICMSGQTLEALARVHPTIINTLNWRTTNSNSYLSGPWRWEQAELVGSTFHATALVQPSALHNNNQLHQAFTEGFVRPEIQQCKDSFKRLLGRNLRGFRPSEMVWCPNVSWLLEEQNFDYCIIGGEHFGSHQTGQWHKGQVFTLGSNVPNLKIISTTNEIMPSDWNTYPHGGDVVKAVMNYARKNNTGRVLLSYDIDPFVSDEGFEKIKEMYLHCLECGREQIQMVNTGALVDSANEKNINSGLFQPVINLLSFYREIGIQFVWEFISSNTNALGNLDFIDWERAQDAYHFIRVHNEKFTSGKANGYKLEEAKKMLVINLRNCLV
eukprot:TRINITY_DN181_c1_g2_i2.p1 TRINITY_DN181_c1_g2~~TRINITY_DN181_c1_g2_i2.p1  ORF type:complete len:369 (+),score=147.92 TRINITY_DN181_c1_g2_i2:125-1231(+)